MITAYFVYCNNLPMPGHKYDWQKEIDEVKQLNPDLLFANCIYEYQPEFIFNNFISGISDWLVENNKKLIIFCSGPDGLELAPNVIIEKTYGYYVVNYDRCRQELFKTVNSNFTRIEPYQEIQAEKWFTCYNNNPKYERGLLVDQLAKHNLFQHGIVTFQFPERVQSPNNIGFTWKYHDGSKLIDEADFVLSKIPEYSPNSFARSYFKGFIDIVTESSFGTNNFFVTEKTCKPIVGLKPFLILSCENYHKNLVEDYGLVLYDELFDYSFDSMPDINDRIQGIIDNLNKIVQWDLSKIKKIHKTLLPKMLYNRQKFLDYGSIKEKMVPKSLQFLTETTDYKLYGNGYQQMLNMMEPWLAK